MITHAGNVAPSMTRYIVTDAHAHKTLKAGDVVVMTELPGTWQNVLLREPDMTLHHVADDSDQYVHLTTEKHSAQSD